MIAPTCFGPFGPSSGTTLMFLSPTNTLLYCTYKMLKYTVKISHDCSLFLSPTNTLLYYTYKMLKYTVKISHDCSYMFRSIWTIIRDNTYVLITNKCTSLLHI